MARINTHLGAARRNRFTTFSARRPAGSESAGYHFDATPAHPAPTRTPTVAPPPSEAANTPAGDYSGARHDYVQAVTALPPAARPATVASAPPSAPALVNLATSLAGSLDAKPSSPLSPAVPTPQVVPPGLEAKTLGSPSLEEILQAAKQGSLAINQADKLTVPRVRQAQQTLAGARADLARGTGLTGPLTPGQATFAEQVAKETGLAPRVIGAQALAEESGPAAKQREAEGNHDWLNIGYNDSGPSALTASSEWAGPHSAARATSRFYKGEEFGPSPGIAAIVPDTAGKGPRAQIAAIGRSGWATNPAYGQTIASTYGQLGERHDPEAVQAFHTAAKQARAVGLNPTPFNGDVNRGTGNTVFVRADAEGMAHWAQSAIGTAEGSPKQRHWAAKTGLSASQPWCADFVSAGLSRRGVSLPPNPNYVPSYESEWDGGHNIGTDLSKAKPGDLVAFSGQHIGVYVGNGEMISGNFGDEVARSPVSSGPAPLSAILRPSYKGGKVAVHESAALPGSSPGSTFGATSGVAGAVPAAAGAGAGAAQQAPAALTQIASPIAAGPVLPQLAGAGGQEGEGGSAELLAQLLAGGGLSSSAPRRRTLLGA